MATGEWYYSKDDEKHGPISSTDLKQLAASRELSPDDLVWKQDWPERKAASTVKGLFISANTESTRSDSCRNSSG